MTRALHEAISALKRARYNLNSELARAGLTGLRRAAVMAALADVESQIRGLYRLSRGEP